MQFTIQFSQRPAKKSTLFCILMWEYSKTQQDVIQQWIPASLQESLKKTLQKQKFKGESQQEVLFPCCVDSSSSAEWPYAFLLCVGMKENPIKTNTTEAQRTLAAAAQVIKAAKRLKVSDMDILVVSPKEHKLPQWWVTFIRGLYLTEYSFKSFSKKEEAYSLERVQLMTNGKVVPPSTQASVKKAAAITQSIAWARDWVNTPSNAKTPTLLANAMAKTVLKTPGLKCKIYTEKNIQSHQMRLLMAVAQGSEEQPRVVHLEYVGKNAKKQAPIVLVGKGVTFDSGGLSLKPPDGMYGMKMDMGGAAAVFAAVWAAAQLNLPIHVHALLGLVENMPSGHAIRPGDIVTARSGKTVEINNTDAEGRLVLADLLDYAQTLKPACVIDVATLTGACMVALGPYCTGLFSNHPKLAQQLQTSADSSGEEMWQLPMPDSLRAQLKSDCADIRNTGDRYGGAITAALFLKEFIHPNVPWGHLDIAGPATRQSEESIYQKGATGVPTATLIHFLENYSAKDL